MPVNRRLRIASRFWRGDLARVRDLEVSRSERFVSMAWAASEQLWDYAYGLQPGASGPS